MTPGSKHLAFYSRDCSCDADSGYRYLSGLESQIEPVAVKMFETSGQTSRHCRKRSDRFLPRILFLLAALGIFAAYHHIKNRASHSDGRNISNLAQQPLNIHVRPLNFGRHILQAEERINNEFAVENETAKDGGNDTGVWKSPHEKNCTRASIHEFPKGFFTEEQKTQGAIAIHFFVCFYMFIALAIVCDDYFVPSLEQLSERLKLTEDVAGATFMAAGSSAPELFISIIGVFVSRGDVGVGTIVGSAVFNILVIIGLCAIFCADAVPLHWWPLMRDSSYYGLAIGVLIVVIHDGLIAWYESLVMLFLYAGYIVIMKFNGTLEKIIKAANEKTVKRCRRKKKQPDTGSCSKDDLSSIYSEKKEEPENIAMMAKCQTEKESTPPVNVIKPLTPSRRPTDVEEGVSTSLLGRMNGNASQTNSTPDSLDSRKPKGMCASQNGTSVVAQLAPQQPTMVPIDEVIMARSRPLGFEEAGLRVMMSSTFAPKTRLRMACKILINERQNLVVQKNQHDGAPQRVLVRRKTDLSLDCGASTPAISERCMTDTLEDMKSISISDPSEDSTSFTHPFVVPRDNCSNFVKWMLCWPISFCFFITIPNCSKKRWQKWFIVSFLLSTAWIAVCSYIMVWMGTICGYTLHIPDSIMGITFLAAGTSVPDTIASVIVARQGLGDMAVSNSIGSNVFDILLGLALPWFLKTAIVSPGTMVEINSKGLFWSVFLLLGSLIFVIISIHLNGWKLTKNLGIIILLTYVMFLTCSLLIEFNIFFPVNLPMCRGKFT